MSTYDGGRFSRLATLAGRRSATRVASPRIHSRLNENALALRRLGQRSQERVQLVEIDGHAGPEESVLAQLVLDRPDVAVVVHQPEQLAEDRRQPVRQPVDRAEVEHAQPPVGQQPEVTRMRIGVQQARLAPGPENRNRTSRMPAWLRCSCVPEEMISASGVPSIHSVTRT